MINKKFTVLIVDDDFFSRKQIKNVLEKEGHSTLLAGNVSKAVAILETCDCDLVVLDVDQEMQLINGITFGEYIKQRFRVPFIYLMCATTLNVVKSAMQNKTSCFLTLPFTDTDLLVEVLTKPLKKKKILAAVELLSPKVATTNESKESTTICVEDGSFKTVLPIQEIDYIQSIGDELHIYSNGILYVQESSIKNILKDLPEEYFLKTHKAFIVNKEKVWKVKSESLLVNGSVIPISKKYIDKIQDALLETV